MPNETVKGFNINGTVVKYDYNSLENKLELDNTLSVTNAAADAKTVGDAIKYRTNEFASTFDSVETGIAYNSDNTSGTSWSGANSYIKTVSAGDVYKISTTIVKSTKYYAVLYYNNTTYVSGEYQGNTSSQTVVTDYLFTIPSGVNKIIITTLNNVTPILTKKEYYFGLDRSWNNYVKYDGTTVKIKARYNKDEDIVVELKKRGNNMLMDFDKIYTVAKAPILTGDFTQARSIVVSNTDWFSPHQVRARENIDGDSSAYFLTGGNHNRDDISTASCDNIHVFVDDAEVSTYDGLCNTVRIKWSNHIQGHNTWKEDGTGRAILDENIDVHVCGTVFDVVVSQIPTENVYQSVYYGIQSINTPYPSVRFVGGSNRGEILSTSSANSGSLNCRKTLAENTSTGDYLETGVHNIDLGRFDLSGAQYSAFTANNKLYYAIMRDQTVTMNQGDLFALYGYYKFYSNKD